MDIKNNILYWSLMVLILSFGAFLIVFGEKDDSPGAQMIGLVMIVTIIITAIKRIKKNSKQNK
ncbi:hypothetical protein KKA18_01855 [Patescibacteria group bacterium]|nr:hypothetical protein [Patescibacteria group bacterium]